MSLEVNLIEKKKFIVDIDGTICSQEVDYSKAKPNMEMIEKLNILYNLGHEIVYFTARGSNTGIDWRDVTEKQFLKWGVKYTSLFFGKPAGDYYIDDKALYIEDFLKGG
jgi:histidinol phosphatase-like enzyme